MSVAAWTTTLARRLVLGAGAGLICGAASALFLWLLDLATRAREGHEALVYGLPLAGLAMGWLIQRFGEPVRRGSDLVIETVHTGGAEIPLRMAPIVLAGTVLTHLFGGSAGREGTAVQMGASLSDWVSHRLRLDASLRREVLAAGIAGGFGSVFGTPIAGAVFGVEVAVVGRIDARALAPALVASVVGDWTTRALGIRHTPYPRVAHLDLDVVLAAKWVAFACAVALVAAAFVELVHFLKKHGAARLPQLPLRMALGGALVVALWKVSATSDYLGLGVPSIVRAFTDPALPAHAFALKLLFTAVTLGAGFLGGEVTPLFFIGAALGNVAARVLGLPIEMGAGVGMAAMFAAASRTPLALSIMAVELLGGEVFPHAAIVSVVAALLVGRRSIYAAQKVHEP